MKKLMFSFLVFGLLAVSGFAQTAGKTATVRIFENYNAESAILIAYATGENETIALESIKGGAKKDADLYLKNQKTINKMFDSMDEKGYELVQSYFVEHFFDHTMLVFKKRD